MKISNAAVVNKKKRWHEARVKLHAAWLGKDSACYTAGHPSGGIVILNVGKEASSFVRIPDVDFAALVEHGQVIVRRSVTLKEQRDLDEKLRHASQMQIAIPKLDAVPL